MAQSGAPSMGSPRPTPPQDPFSVPLTAPVFSLDPENEAEWEYEYSTTETETYYVTLDLSTPHVPPPRRALPIGGRNRKVRWVNPGLETTKKRDLRELGSTKKRDARELKNSKKPGAGRGETADQGEASESQNEDTEDQEESDAEQTDESSQSDGQGRRGSRKDGQGKQKSKGAHVGSQNVDQSLQQGANNADPSENKVPDKPSSVQILDLHSQNPVVSYRGHTYSCQWVSNIGTELLFTPHDSNDPLPSLRNLPGDVDLLAASSARIISTSIELKPKERSVSFLQPSSGRKKASRPSIRIGRGASTQRKNQARFLEQLINVKEEKGEYDPVTVFAGARKPNFKWNEQLQRRQRFEKERLQKAIRKGGKGSRKAREELEELEKDEARRKEMLQPIEGKHGPEGGKSKKRKRDAQDPLAPKRGRPPKKKSVPSALVAAPGDDAPSEVQTPGYGKGSIAPSTPQRFESQELENSEMEDEEMEDDESGEEQFYEDDSGEEQSHGGESGEEQFFEDEELSDEDAPGEDDDM